MSHKYYTLLQLLAEGITEISFILDDKHADKETRFLNDTIGSISSKWAEIKNES